MTRRESHAVAAIQAAIPEGYFVGGCVRDWLLNRPLKDLDVAVPIETPDDGQPLGSRIYGGIAIAPDSSDSVTSQMVSRIRRVGRAVASDVGGSFFWLRERMGVGRVTVLGDPPLQIDMVPLTGSLEADLRRRDFTFNAMAVPVRDGLTSHAVIVDPTGGREDLAIGRLRLAAPDALRQDPLRCLRAFRFRATLHLTFAPGMDTAIQTAAPGLARVSGERIRDELFVLLSGSPAASVFEELLAHELVSCWSPQLAASARGYLVAAASDRAAPVSGVQLAGALEHWLEVRASGLSCKSDLTETLTEMVTAPRSRRALAVLAALSFHAGPESSEIVRTLSLSSDETRVISRSIGGAHCLLSAWPVPGRGRLVFWQQWEPGAVEAVLLAMAYVAAQSDTFRTAIDSASGDSFSANSPAVEHTGSLEELLADLLQRRLRPQPPLLTGGEVMELLRLPPGPQIGRVLQQVEERRADHLLNTPEQAREWLMRNPQAQPAPDRRKR